MDCKKIVSHASLFLLLLTLPLPALSAPAPSLGTFSNTAPIIIGNSSAATPYPSPITVSGITGTVGMVRVKLNNVSHTWSGDIGVLLVGPQGQKVVLMDSVGGNAPLQNADLVFEDTGSALSYGPIVSGTYQPTDLNISNFTFPSPAPVEPYSAALSIFSNLNPNGTWQLFVRDSYPEDDFGTITGGWQIEFIAPSFTVSGLPGTITAGVPFDLTVTALNQNGSTDSNYNGSIYFTSTSASSVLPATYSFVPADNGTHTFSVTLKSSGSQTITVFDATTSGRSGTSAPISVTAGPRVSLKAVAGTPQGAVPNGTYAIPFQALVSDAYSNPVPGVQVTFNVVPEAGAGGTFTGNLSSVSVTTDANGIAIPPTFTANSVLGSFTVSATAADIVTPAVFNLTNCYPPAITSQPQPVTILAGQIPNLSVTANSTLPLTYQWYRGARGDTTSPVINAKSATFNQPVDSTGTFWVRVANLLTADSVAVLVTVNHPAVITAQPEAQFIQSGQSATLNVSASGDGISYQWYQGASGVTTSPIPGATTSSYTTPLMYGPASYWVRVTGIYGVPADSTAAQVITASTKGTSSNNNVITIRDNSTALPYPSTITVPVGFGSFDTVRVTLTNVNHSFPVDIGVLLVGPGGQKVVLMNQVGGGASLVGTTLVFDDAGSALTDAPIVSGTYRPSDPYPSNFPSPAPSRPYDTSLAAFNGTDPGGTWSLFILDRVEGDAGRIDGGWQIEFIKNMLALTIVIDGSGQGFVRYQQSGVTVNTDYATSVPTGEQVTLEPTADQYSIFTGWSGNMPCTTGNCIFNISSNTVATAAFTLDIANEVLVDPGHYHATISDAYKDTTTPSGAKIKMWGINFTENLLLDKDKTVTLEGGYNSTFSSQDPGVFTTITGSLTIKGGKVIANRIILK